MKSLAALIASLVIFLPSTAPAAVDSSITLWPAKTQTRAFAIGTVSPARPGQIVKVRLLQDGGPGFTRVAATKVKLSAARDDDGDGVSESHYSVGFDRPSNGTCKFVVIYPGDARTSRAREAEIFPCATPQFGTGSATITSENGIVDLRLDIAETGEQLGYGLMYRRWLAPDKGMAFLWSSDTSGSFYMLNTLLPLSIAFFDQGGRIVRIMDMDPCDEEPCPRYNPEVPYRGALEVNQGAFTTWGVTEGDIITITR